MSHTVTLSTGEKIKCSNGHSRRIRWPINLFDKVNRCQLFTKRERKWQTPEVLLREYACGVNAGRNSRDKRDIKRYDKVSRDQEKDAWARGFIRGFNEKGV